MKSRKKQKRYGKVPVQFYAPPELVKDYRAAIPPSQTMSQDLRRYMAERIKEAA